MERGHLVPGDRLGKYRLERLVGRGGMGEVWAAHDPDLDRKIALKILRPQLGANDDARLRLQREGRAMARLRHPNVITVFDATFSDDRGIIAMELVDGESLAAWMTRHHPASEIVRVLLAAGRELAAAHAANMIHRDFKPHNVLVDRDGRVLVTDFGLARETVLREASPKRGPEAARPVSALEATAASDLALDATAAPAPSGLDETATPATVATAAPSRPGASGDLDTPLTETGALLGTPAYMAPEQLVGEPADAKADQFAFCVTMWEAFTGERPFRGKTVDELVEVVGGDPGANPKVPRRLRSLLARGLARAPEARWSSMAELLAALERAWRRPRVIAAIAGAAFALAAIATTIVLVSGRTTERMSPGCDPMLADALWTPTLRNEIEHKFSTPAEAKVLLGALDRWTSEWKSEQAAACGNTHATDFEARLGCLTALRSELAPLVARNTELAATAYTDPTLWRLLTPPSQCRTHPRSIPLVPTDPAVAIEVGKLRGELLAARSVLTGRTLVGLLVNAAPLVERAKATRYEPVMVEAELVELVAALLRSGTAPAGLCPKLLASAQRARVAAYPRMEIEALLLAYRCGLANGYDKATQDAVRDLSTLNEIATPIQRFDIALLLGREAIQDGYYNAAAQFIAQARSISDEHLLAANEVDLNEAILRFARGRGDDLLRALEIIQATRSTPTAAQVAEAMETEIEWRLGKARPAKDQAKKPKPEDVVVELTVVDDRGPVPGAAVGASLRATVDATRVVIPGIGDPAVATCDSRGRVTLRVSPRSVIVARLGDRIGAIAAPAKSGAQTLTIGASGAITGKVANIDPDVDDPTDLASRARRRSRAVVHLSRFVGERLLTFSAPVHEDGTWSLPVVMPGPYTYAVQAEVALRGVHGIQRPIEVTAGANTAPEVAFDAVPQVVELDVRPVDGGGVALPGGEPVPKTWSELHARLATVPYVSIGVLRSATIDDSTVNPDDKITRMPVGPGPVTVCVLAGISYERMRPVSRVGQGTRAELPAPRCRVVTPGGPVTRVQIP